MSKGAGANAAQLPLPWWVYRGWEGDRGVWAVMLWLLVGRGRLLGSRSIEMRTTELWLCITELRKRQQLSLRCR